mmetsp:Transcript_30802/g.80675  ORF Transcript_30802/g.80675 Transcript_30802/m.80675 type:complete len:86 (-) Transcript_30802:243-500(-)
MIHFVFSNLIAIGFGALWILYVYITNEYGIDAAKNAFVYFCLIYILLLLLTVCVSFYQHHEEKRKHAFYKQHIHFLCSDDVSSPQ